ncbi:hypothetical protein TNCV_3076481 [Trichonephila clavipes]|nr:hypothetical protein TNCV_3076481 [Trichonephila clavipes]
MTIHRPLMSESYAPTNRYATCHLCQHTIEPDYGGVWLDQSFHYPPTMNPPYYGQATDSHKGKKVGGFLTSSNHGIVGSPPIKEKEIFMTFSDDQQDYLLSKLGYTVTDFKDNMLKLRREKEVIITKMGKNG